MYMYFAKLSHHKPSSWTLTLMKNLALFMLIYNWWMMTVFKTHYWIDIVGGITVAVVCSRLGEWVSYYVDVKVLGLRHEERYQCFFNPCPKCGWSNDKAARFIDTDE